MITLQVNGREMTFSEEEVASILEEHFTSTTPKRPLEGVPFKVNPLGIKRDLFQEKRENAWEEDTRQLILEAFAKADENPERYGKRFKTMMPAKTWDCKTADELKKLATKLGDHMADWVEQALEWARRIQNGETWEALCNKADTAKWYRLVVWKNGYARIVGGARKDVNSYSASDVNDRDEDSNSEIYYTVPLVVLY